MTSMDNKEKEKQVRAANKARDFELVDKARDGDRRAFNTLVELYQKRVYAIAFGILRSREDAWDAAQEAFVKAYKNLDRFEGKAAFYTWLYRITYNLSIDHLRSRKRHDTVAFDEGRGLESALDKAGHTVGHHPDEVADRKELAKVLHDAMAKLTDKHRAIIVLREVEGLAYEEMAEVLGISKGTVMSRLFHARKNLQGFLRPYVDSGNEIPESITLVAPATA